MGSSAHADEAGRRLLGLELALASGNTDDLAQQWQTLMKMVRKGLDLTARTAKWLDEDQDRACRIVAVLYGIKDDDGRPSRVNARHAQAFFRYQFYLPVSLSVDAFLQQPTATECLNLVRDTFCKKKTKAMKIELCKAFLETAIDNLTKSKRLRYIRNKMSRKWNKNDATFLGFFSSSKDGCPEVPARWLEVNEALEECDNLLYRARYEEQPPNPRYYISRPVVEEIIQRIRNRRSHGSHVGDGAGNRKTRKGRSNGCGSSDGQTTYDFSIESDGGSSGNVISGIGRTTDDHGEGISNGEDEATGDTGEDVGGGDGNWWGGESPQYYAGIANKRLHPCPPSKAGSILRWARRCNGDKKRHKKSHQPPHCAEGCRCTATEGTPYRNRAASAHGCGCRNNIPGRVELH